MLKVLLADDEYLEREALKIILHEGIQDAVVVGEAQTGKNAVELFDAHHPNLVFMDIKMPIMDGLEAAEIIKKQSRDTIVILLTAYESFQYAQRAIRFGADDYILKPARPHDIITAVNKQISLREMNRTKEILLDGLIGQVQNENYRLAKQELKQVVKQVLSAYGDHPEKLSEWGQIIARRLGETAEQIGFKMQTAPIKALQTVSFFNLEEKAFDLLAEIFNELVEQRRIGENSSIQGILNYIEKYYVKGITLEEVAEYAHLSPYYLSKLFKKELKINFVNYVMERRIEQAKELLTSTDLPILNISLELSYNEPNYFSKVFKKVVGMTPTEYREVKLNEPKDSVAYR